MSGAHYVPSPVHIAIMISEVATTVADTTKASNIMQVSPSWEEGS